MSANFFWRANNLGINFLRIDNFIELHSIEVLVVDFKVLALDLYVSKTVDPKSLIKEK